MLRRLAHACQVNQIAGLAQARRRADRVRHLLDRSVSVASPSIHLDRAAPAQCDDRVKNQERPVPIVVRL
jgi:hypothetical protein